MTKIKNLKPGSILSETSFFKVKSIEKNDIIVTDDFGNDLKIGNAYAEKILNSADYFETEEKKTMTELADILKNNPRVAMTVAFYKKDVNKTQKAYKAEVEAAIKEVQEATVSKVEAILKNLIENPISKVIPGELRVMRGRHYGYVDDLGRIHFVDMEQEKGSNPESDSRMRQIDPRTIQYIIVNGVKYLLK